MAAHDDSVGGERRRAQRALQETEERFRAIFESAPDCIFVKDVNLRYTHVNPAMAALFKRPVEQLVGVTDDDLFDAATVARVRETDRRVLAGEVREEVQTSLVGGVPHVFHTVKVPLRDINSRVSGLCGIARDVTDLRRAELVERALGGILNAGAASADLRSLIERIRALLGPLIDTTNFYVALYDESTGRYSFPFYADEFDSLEEFEPTPQPRSLTDYVRRNGRPILLGPEQFAELAQRGEVGLVGTDSKQWLGVPLITDRGVIGVTAVQSYHDESLYSEQDLELLNYAAGTISIAVERKRAEEQRQALEAKVLQAQKLESLGVLAGGLAHEFNNLLQGILGSSGLAARLLPAESPVQRQLAAIERAANDAAQLTRQMLAYSGKAGFMVEDVDVSAVVAKMAPLIEASIAKQIELRLSLQAGLPLVKADAAELRQVVMNLLTNSAEAIGPAGGRISITTDLVIADRAMLSATTLGEELPEGRYLVLEVADTGSGMDARTLERIFDPFFSTKFAGRGLGLPAVLGIVRSLRGAVRVSSRPGLGTTIGILIPAARELETAKAAVDAAAARPGRAHRVLVVDDDDVVRSLIAEMLQEAGYEVVAAADGHQALGVYCSAPAAIDVVLLDMTMPGLDGRATFQQLRQASPGVRVVVSSGYSEQDAMGRFAEGRPAGYLQKPFRMAELVGAVRRACVEKPGS